MANQSIRVRTTPGVSNNIRVKLDQDFDFLEILSLKISQEDLYQTFCANYGVVVGRVIANKGFGVPNAKVSIFVPITDADQNNALIKDLYPFKTPYQKDKNNIRYNLLLSKTTCQLNTPVGTFPTKEEVLDNDIMLEVFETYYKYTTKTNHAGDFMIFGVPVGQQTVHMDLDLSDIGAASVRPYDLVSSGYPENLFNSQSQFKSSTNLDSLPQIKSGNIAVDVIPFWGDTETCSIGISRVDFDTNFEITTSALFMGSVFTDSGRMALNKECSPRQNQGEQNHLRTGAGTIEMIRVSDYDHEEWFTNGDINPSNLESFSVDGGQLIDDDGVFTFPVPMNIGHVITDEYGNLVPSLDPAVGIATKGMYRFKMALTEANTNPKFRTANMIFPSLGSNFGGTLGMVDTGFLAQANGTQDQRWTTDISQYHINTYPNSRIDLDFHTFEWKQLYTIAHFIKKYKYANPFSTGIPNTERWGFLGIKNTDITSQANLFPFTTAIWNFSPIYYVLASFVDFFAFMIQILLTLIGLCIQLCFQLVISFNIGRHNFSFTIIPPFCYQICPFAWLGGLIPSFSLPCQNAPNEVYTIPPNGLGTLASCNPNGCSNGNLGCNCNQYNYNIVPDVIGLNINGLSSSSNVCLQSLNDWKCCIKLNIADANNVIRLVFNDAWVFGTAYMFQFKYKQTIGGKEKFCGPGSKQLHSVDYGHNTCCIDNFDPIVACTKCLLRGPNETRTNHHNDPMSLYHIDYHNYSLSNFPDGSKNGASDVGGIIYCNSLMSTKIVSLGRIEMCDEALEEIQSSIQAGQALNQYVQSGGFYTGTFFEDGWNTDYWENILKETSYEDPRDVLMYLSLQTHPTCSLRELFTLGGIVDGQFCHEHELKDNPYFLMKEVSKIYADIELDNSTNSSSFGSFNPDTNNMFPYADLLSEDPYHGGFVVNKDVASRFSPCGGGPSNENCVGQPNNKWTNNGIAVNPNEADNDAWDYWNDRNGRNNQNTRSNIPYYYFGIKPGKTAINKLRKIYFTPNK